MARPATATRTAPRTAPLHPRRISGPVRRPVPVGAPVRGRTGAFDCSAMDWFIERARALGVQERPPDPILLGRHVLALGVAPGPRVGEILAAVYERQLDGEVTTLDQAIATAETLLGNARNGVRS